MASVPYAGCTNNETEAFVRKYIVRPSGCRVLTSDPERPYRVTVIKGRKGMLTWKRQ